MATNDNPADLRDSYVALMQGGTALVLTSQNCGVDSLRPFLAEIPNGKLTIDPAMVELDAGRLRVGGPTTDRWGVPGWGAQALQLTDVQLVFDKVEEALEFSFALTSTVALGSRRLTLQGTRTDDNALHLSLPVQPALRSSLSEVAELVSNGRLGGYLPSGVELFDDVPLTRLEFEFGFAKAAPTASTFSSDIGVDWPIVDDVFVLKGVGVSLYASAHYAASGNLVEAFGGDMHAKLVIGEEFTVRLALNGDRQWRVEVIPGDGNLLPGLAHLARLVGGDSLEGVVQNSLDQAGMENLSLDYVGIGLDIQNKKVSDAVVTGHVSFQGLTFAVGANLPEFSFFGGLSPQTPIHLRALVGKFFPGADAFPQVDVTRLDVAIAPRMDSYAFAAKIESDWTLTVGTVELGFRKFDMAITKQGREFTATVLGEFDLLGAPFDVSAEHPAAGAGWLFDASTVPENPIHLAPLITSIAAEFGTSGDMPAFFEQLAVQKFDLSFNTESKDFVFVIDTTFTLDQTEAEVQLTIDLTHNDNGFVRKFGGVITVGDLEFDLVFNQAEGADSIFLAAYENKSGKNEDVRDLAALITSSPDVLALAQGMSFNLKDALLVVDKGDATKVLFGLDIGGGLDISKLPLVGKMFPAESSLRMTLQPLLANADFTQSELSTVRQLAPSGGYQLPPTVAKGIGFDSQLHIGDQVVDLALPISVDAVKQQSAAPVTSSTASVGNVTASPPAATTGVTWFSIQKQLGPVHFGRVGMQFEKPTLYLLIDASLEAAGLTISLDGLFAGSELNPIHPRFGLHGLGIDYRKGPLEIGGAFLRQTLTDANNNHYDSYDGTVVIRTEQFELGALGSYAYYQGHPSLFVYALLDAALGGPVFFFVTGLAASFGYNRRIVVPGIDGIRTFPLVAEAVTPVPDSANDLTAVLARLHDAVPPAVGEYFLAAGVRFSSFRIIDSFALLTVSFGREFEVDVLGLSTLVIPTPDEPTAVEPLAEVQLALKAAFNPDKGYLKVRAGLTAASFILSRNCHLTGGFAFYTWFKDSREESALAGDFVLTLGGYHKRFKPPAYYPKVASLGFNWPVSSELLVKGDCYFALVPSATMAGGHFSATWHSGNLKAWFRLGADFIISWRPYFYDASMYLDMGVSYTYHFFGTHHLTVHLGADLHIWGPEFSGKAHVHLWVVTFDVRFGAHSKQEPKKLSWREFRSSFLPDNTSWLNVSASQGLVRQIGGNDDPLLVVNPKAFALDASSAIPITSSNHSLGQKVTPIHIGAMKIVDDVDSSCDVRIELHGENDVKTDVTGEFRVTPVKKPVPGALWGPEFRRAGDASDETDDKRLVKDVCVGFSITGKPALPSEETHGIPTSKLLSERQDFEPSARMGDEEALPFQWLKTQGTRQLVADTIEGQSKARDELLAAMGFSQPHHPNKTLAEHFVVSTI